MLVYEFLLFAISDHTFRFGTLSFLFRRTMNGIPPSSMPRQYTGFYQDSLFYAVLFCFTQESVFNTSVDFRFH